MRVLIETVGSAGDVHPFVAVGRALAARGHDVVLFSNEHFRERIEGAGLALRTTSSAADYEALTADPDLWHPTRGPAVVLGHAIEHLLEPTTDALLAAVVPGQTIVVAPSLGFAGRCAAEIAGAPLVRVHLQPSVLRSLVRPPRLPGLWMPDGAPAWWKRLLYRVADVAIDRIVCPRLDAFRARRGLPRARRVFDRWMHEADALLALYPDWFAPPPPDAPAGLRHAGFALFDGGAATPLSGELAAWLGDGDPPIVFTHGSANRHAHAFFAASARAARAVGRRALLVTTEPSAVAGLLDADVRHAGYVPFGAVLSCAAAFVHHGGIGTTAQGLAAGVPQLVVPMGFDQPDNAARVERLGVGRALAARRWTPSRAAASLGALLADDGARASARDLAPRVRGDDAAGTAATVIASVG